MVKVSPVRRIRRRPAGFTFIVILLLLGLVLTIATAVTARVHATLGNVTHREQVLRATYAANVGLQMAMGQLTEAPDWEPATEFVGSLDSDSKFGYRVKVVNNRLGTTARSGPGGVTVPPKRVWLKATGTYEGVALGHGAGQAEALTARPEPVFNYAMVVGVEPFSSSDLIFQGVTVDSFRSLPAYVPPSSSTEREASVLNHGSYLVRDGAMIDGDLVNASEVPSVYTMTGGSFTGVARADGGEILPLVFRMPRAMRSLTPSNPPSAGSIAPGRYSELDSNPGGTITLTGGDYYFTSFLIGDGGKVELDASVNPGNPCKVYVGSAIEFGPNTTANFNGGNPGVPRHLQFYGTDEGLLDCTTAHLGQSAKVSAIFAGENMWFNSALYDNQEFYGAMNVGTAWTGSGSKIYYDTSLRDVVLEGVPEWVLVSQNEE